MTPEQNKAIVARAFEELMNKRNFAQAPEFYVPDFKRSDIGRLFPERSKLIAGIPDLRTELIDVFAEGDRVCVRYLAYGTHTGELLGKPGTGKNVRWEGINIYRMADGKIAESWHLADVQLLLQQIGTLPQESGA